MDVEQRARELLAAEYRKAGANPASCELMAGRASWPNQMALNAIIAALTPPEGDMGNPISVPDGFVLVPVEPTEAMVHAGLNAPFRGHPETGGPSLPDMWTAMLAARPEVKP
ncbi:hypothetical protein ACYPJF_07730 [Stenotrophomonas geniculata]